MQFSILSRTKMELTCISAPQRAVFWPPWTPAFAGVTTGELEQIPQHRDERLVGGRHRIIGELRRAHPFQSLALARHDDPLPFAAQVKRHQQVEGLVAIRGEGVRREAALVDRDAEL